jgi:signal peptidase I
MQLSLNDVEITFVNRDFAFYLSITVLVCIVCKGISRVYPNFLSKPGFVKSIRDFIGSSFWELVAVLIIRAFFYEMYLIPSGSMQPSLYPGDLILVNKYAFGFKVPGTNMMLKAVNHPARGDVVVFLEPKQPTQRKMIKRAIGLPGDHVQITDHCVKVNGEELSHDFLHKTFEYLGSGSQKVRVDALFYQQQLGNHSVVIEQVPAVQRHFDLDFIVPQGHYFVMGDNRDNSQDSRYWGFVPERFLCGKAQLVLFSFGSREQRFSLERVGSIV